MAHDPFRATRRPRPTDAAETPQDAFSGPPAGLTPDPPQDAHRMFRETFEAEPEVWVFDGPLAAGPLPPVPESAYPPGAEPIPVEYARSYPCRLASCGQVLASPGALGGHMAAHRKRGELG